MEILLYNMFRICVCYIIFLSCRPYTVTQFSQFFCPLRTSIQGTKSMNKIYFLVFITIIFKLHNISFRHGFRINMAEYITYIYYLMIYIFFKKCGTCATLKSIRELVCSIALRNVEYNPFALTLTPSV